MPDTQMTPEEIEALRAERDLLLTERDGERSRADAEARRADSLHGQVLDGSRRLNESAVNDWAARAAQADSVIAGTTTEIAGLKAQAVALRQEGKFEEAEDVAEKLAEAVASRKQAQQAKAHFAQQVEVAKAVPADPVDRFFAQNPQFTDAEKDWIKRNPRYATDREFQERVNGAHAKVIEKGVARHSEAYFQELERAGYMRQAPAAARPAARTGGEVDDDAGDPDDQGNADSPYSGAAVEDDPVQTPQRPAPRTAAAPASRRAPTAPNPRGRVVAELTAEQVDTALRNADLAPPEVQEGGDAAVMAWWSENNRSPMAQRLRGEWAGG